MNNAAITWVLRLTNQSVARLLEARGEADQRPSYCEFRRPRRVSRYYPCSRHRNPRASRPRKTGKTELSRACRARATGFEYRATRKSTRVSDIPKRSLVRGFVVGIVLIVLASLIRRARRPPSVPCYGELGLGNSCVISHV
jgi:hypothetical protein